MVKYLFRVMNTKNTGLMYLAQESKIDYSNEIENRNIFDITTFDDFEPLEVPQFILSWLQRNIY